MIPQITRIGIIRRRCSIMAGTCDAPGANFHALVGDTIYFDACDASQSYGNEMYAFNTVNGSYVEGCRP